nr:chlorhexidine efflux transporter [Enterobacter hormaechei]
MQHQDALQRKLPERIFHAVCFEGIATAILAPTAAWLMQRSVVEMGGSYHYSGDHGNALEHYL